MNDTEDLRLLRQMHSSCKLNDKEFSTAKALLLNFGLSIAEGLQQFQQMHAMGELTDRELSTAQTMLLALPKESDRIHIVRSDSVDSSYEQRQLHRESILDQFDRAWEDRASTNGTNGNFMMGCGSVLLGICVITTIFVILGLHEPQPYELLPIIISISFLILGLIGVLGGAKEARDYREAHALYRRLRGNLANRADAPVRIPT